MIRVVYGIQMLTAGRDLLRGGLSVSAVNKCNLKVILGQRRPNHIPSISEPSLSTLQILRASVFVKIRREPNSLYFHSTNSVIVRIKDKSSIIVGYLYLWYRRYDWLYICAQCDYNQFLVYFRNCPTMHLVTNSHFLNVTYSFYPHQVASESCYYLFLRIASTTITTTTIIITIQTAPIPSPAVSLCAFSAPISTSPAKLYHFYTEDE